MSKFDSDNSKPLRKTKNKFENKLSENESLSDEEGTKNEDGNEDDENRNENDENRNEDKEFLSLKVSIPKKYSSGLPGTMDSDSMEVDNNTTGKVNETKLVCHSAGSFYKKSETTGRCFYKDDESSSDENGYYGNSRRKAAKKVKYTMFSESEGDDEVGVATERSKKRKTQGQGGYNTDSDFVVS